MTGGRLLGDILDDDENEEEFFLVPVPSKSPPKKPALERKPVNSDEPTIPDDNNDDDDNERRTRKIRCRSQEEPLDQFEGSGQFSAQRTQKRKRWIDGVLISTSTAWHSS